MALHRFEIPRRHRACVLGKEDFSPGQFYFSLLENLDEGVERKDYCLECWNSLHKQNCAYTEGKIFWKSSIPKKKEVSEEALRRDEKALKLLREYATSTSQNERSQAFILALLLTRNKLLQLKQEFQEDGYLLQLYEVRSTEEMITIQKVDLSLIQTDLVQTQLSEKLGS